MLTIKHPIIKALSEEGEYTITDGSTTIELQVTSVQKLKEGK